MSRRRHGTPLGDAATAALVQCHSWCISTRNAAVPNVVVRDDRLAPAAAGTARAASGCQDDPKTPGTVGHHLHHHLAFAIAAAISTAVAVAAAVSAAAAAATVATTADHSGAHWCAVPRDATD